LPLVSGKWADVGEGFVDLDFLIGGASELIKEVIEGVVEAR
jgi:hypothetical protein